MGIKAFTKEWAETFCEKINQNDEFRKTAAEWKSPIILKYDADES